MSSSPTVPARSVARFFAHYLAQQRGQVALLGLVMLVHLALVLTQPWLVQRFVDGAIGGRADAAQTLNTLTILGVAYLATAVVIQLMTLAQTYIAQNIGMRATNAIRTDLTLHCLSLDMAFHNARTPGELIERVDGDAGQLSPFFSHFLVVVALNGALLVGVLVLLFYVDAHIGLAVLICVSVAVLLNRFLLFKQAAASERERETAAALFGYLEERLSGTEDIRANGAVGYVLGRHVERERAHVRAGLRQALIGVASWRSVDVPIDTGKAIAIALAALMYLDGALTLGSVYVVVTYGAMLTDPIEVLTRQMGALQSAIASARRVQSLFAERSSLSMLAGPAQALPAGPLDVELRDVTFAYPGDEPVLRAVSVTVPTGKTLGVIGRTGSGKTTLARLMLRLYDVNAGAVRIGGVDVRQASNDDLRARTAVVTQDVQLFNASVRDNLTLFDGTISDARVRGAIAAVGMEAWLASLPEGLDTRLDGSGGLSAGEAQLLAFARTFLRDPGLVILDEASSRLDPASERRLDAAVDRLLRGRTGVIIAHRLSTLDRVDLILILEEGNVREFGPRALLAADPASRYSQLLATGIEALLE